MSEWPSTDVWILDYSGPQCNNNDLFKKKSRLRLDAYQKTDQKTDLSNLQIQKIADVDLSCQPTGSFSVFFSSFLLQYCCFILSRKKSQLFLRNCFMFVVSFLFSSSSFSSSSSSSFSSSSSSSSPI